MRTTIYLHKKEMDLIDTYSETYGLSRSATIRFCINKTFKSHTDRV